MKDWLHVGAEVVFVSPVERAARYGDVSPQVGAHYTIREIREGAHGLSLLLNEIVNRPRRRAHGKIVETGWYAFRFRPVRREQIQIFLDIAASVDPTVSVGA